LRPDDFFFALDFLALFFFADFFLAGTFAPSARASDSPIAMACLLLFTLAPLRPDFSFPFLKAFISRSTDFEAAEPYFFFDDAFFLAMFASVRARMRVSRYLT
jgi:hypothetical protein